MRRMRLWLRRTWRGMRGTRRPGGIRRGGVIMSYRKRYLVKAQVYVLADDIHEAVDMVYSDLEYLTECDGGVIGFTHPTLDDVVEEKEQS